MSIKNIIIQMYIQYKSTESFMRQMTEYNSHELSAFVNCVDIILFSFLLHFSILLYFLLFNFCSPASYKTWANSIHCRALNCIHRQLQLQLQHQFHRQKGAATALHHHRHPRSATSPRRRRQKIDDDIIMENPALYDKAWGYMSCDNVDAPHSTHQPTSHCIWLSWQELMKRG